MNMTMVPYDIEKLGIAHYARYGNMNLIEQFRDSDYDCVEVKNYPQKSSRVCVSSLRVTISKMRCPNIDVTYRGDRVFLIKKKI